MRTLGFQILYWGFHGTAVIGLTEFGLQSGPAVTVSFQSGRYLHAVSGGKIKSPADFLRAGRLTPVAFQKSAGFLSTSQFLPRAAFHGDLRPAIIGQEEIR